MNASNMLAAALFVVGCIGFYWPALYTASVTAFLCGSVLFLLGAVMAARADPSGDRSLHSSRSSLAVCG